MNEMKTVCTKLPEHLYDKLSDQCLEQDDTLSQLIRRLLKRWLAEQAGDAGA